MNETMWRLQSLLLAKPKAPGRLTRAARALVVWLKPVRPVHKNDVIVMRGCAAALIAIGLLAASGNLHAEPTDAQKQAAHKQCRAELGPLGIPLWTADGVVICQRVTMTVQR